MAATLPPLEIKPCLAIAVPLPNLSIVTTPSFTWRPIALTVAPVALAAGEKDIFCVGLFAGLAFPVAVIFSALSSNKIFMELKNKRCEAIRIGMGIIGSRWKLVIIELLRGGTKRYGELKRLMPLISEKVLINELKSLVELELIERKSYPEVPPKVEYCITEKGKMIFPVIDVITEWSVNHLEQKE